MYLKRGIDVSDLFGRWKGREGGLCLGGKGFRLMSDDFLYRDVPAFGRKVLRLGLATNYGVDGEDLEWALEQGVNYIFWTPTARRVTNSLKAALKRDRESIVLATGPTIGYFGGSIRGA